MSDSLIKLEELEKEIKALRDEQLRICSLMSRYLDEEKESINDFKLFVSSAKKEYAIILEELTQCFQKTEC